jgi:hypothetical protein
MATIEEILAKAKPRTEVISICLAGDLRAEHNRLVAELDRLDEQAVVAPRKMGTSNGEARGIAERIQALEAEMGKASQEFRFQGISEDALEGLRERFPPREGKRETWNVSAAGPALVAACAVEPPMTEAQAEMLRKSLAQGDWDLLVEAAWTATSSRDASVPFSARASALTRISGSK